MLEQIRQSYWTISKPTVWKVLTYLAEHRAVTALIIHRRLGMPRSSAFLALEELRKMGIVERATTVKIPNRRGSKANLYCLPNMPVEAIRKASILHSRLLSSSNSRYRIADDVAQKILEVLQSRGIREIRKAEVVDRVRNLKIPYSTPDISEIVCQILIENDTIIWE